MRGPVEVASGVHGLGTPIVNWYVVEDGGRLTAVDAGLPAFAKTLEADLRALGHAPADVEAVVLTHSDPDHTGVAGVLQEAGARVLVHGADEATLRRPGPKGGDASLPRLLPQLRRRAVRTVLADTIRHGGLRPPRIAPDATIADGDVLDVPGRPRVVHTPGHTPGHCALLFEDRGVLVAGDALITHPLVTGGAGPMLMWPWVNVDTRQALASLDRLESLEADVTLFGHGDPWTERPAAAVARARRAAA